MVLISLCIEGSDVSPHRIPGVFGKRQKIQAMLCGCVVNSQLPPKEGEESDAGTGSSKFALTGTVTGHMFVWDTAAMRCDRMVSLRMSGSMGGRESMTLQYPLRPIS